MPGVLAGVRAQRMVTWFYRQRILYEGFSAAGTQVFNSTINVVTNRSGLQVTKVYGAAYPALDPLADQSRRAERAAAPPDLPDCLIGVAPLGSSWRAALSKAVSCGLFRLDGRQWVDGVDALKIASKPDNGLPAKETIWVIPGDVPARAGERGVPGRSRVTNPAGLQLPLAHADEGQSGRVAGRGTRLGDPARFPEAAV